MISWNPYPFFRLIIPFAAGILTAIFIPLPFTITAQELLIACGVAFVPAAISYFIKSYRFRWITGCLIYIFMLVSGFSLTYFHTPLNRPFHISSVSTQGKTFVVRITEPVTEKANSYKTVGKVLELADSTGIENVNGQLLLYFEKDSAAAGLAYGDILIAKARVSPVQPPGNPHQFDYRRYLSYNGIYHQVFLRNGEWIKTGQRKVNPVFDFAYRARGRMMQILAENGITGDEFAVVSAILLGYDEHMDPELRDKYAGAGALHVLCVSGLHVGIIFFILSFLLKNLDRNQWTRLIKTLLLLSSIWLYAFITGLSPSVMRAGVMFSLFAWRESRREKSNPYNILAASAFILLVIDPYMITKIGFQLSYAAVIAIISLFTPIYKLIAVKNTIMDYFWKLTVVSFAAQVGTFPLAIYYFHQFPVYFFITNLIVIPLVWLILNTGILVFITSVISHVLSVKFSILLYMMLMGLNNAVEFIHSLPGSTVHGLVLILPQVVIIYLVIIFLTRSFITRQSAQLIAAMSLLILLTGGFIYRKLNILNQQKIIVYAVNGHSAIDMINGTQALMIADSAFFADDRLIDFNISGNRIYSGIKSVIPSNFQPYSLQSVSGFRENFIYTPPGFIGFENKTFVIVDPSFPTIRTESPVHADYLILRNNPKFNLRELQDQFDFRLIIFDASNSFWKISEWKSQCEDLDIKFHDVRNDGYFLANL